MTEPLRAGHPASTDLVGHEAQQRQARAEMLAEAHRRLRSMTPAEKLRAAERLYHSARELKAAALRSQHPEWSEQRIEAAVRETFLLARD